MDEPLEETRKKVTNGGPLRWGETILVVANEENVRRLAVRFRAKFLLEIDPSGKIDYNGLIFKFISIQHRISILSFDAVESN
jgi:hypothetical protein